MIRPQLFLICALLVAAFAVSASAQRPAGSPAAQPAPTPGAQAPTAVALPVSKMAVIYTDMFLDPKTGIGKFNSVLTKLNNEFQNLKNEIQGMQTKAQQLEDEINKLQNAPAGTPIDQRSLQAKIDQLEQLKKDIQRKGEDAQASYNRRRQELFTPLQTEIGNALEAFAKARGINVIIDAAQVPLLYAADSIDITRAFITDFNSKNPVTAASTTTPPE
ncbi:MAG TPA: OmpH family outer membrane protein [Pyrinomonadaceae bacterium]|jgi:outer membrane protein|nr:OmpH family outer membrane protein [Pyrinomonadaceae bacterium]